MNHKIRIVIVDDHELVLDGLKARLSRCDDIEIIGVATNGEDALETVSRLQPDVVLIDINMPMLSGIEAVEILSEKHGQIASLILSVHDDREYIMDAAQAGAKGYLLKSASAADMILAIRTVYEGGFYYSPEVAECLLQQRPDTQPLTRREQTIISLLASGSSSKDMAEELNISVRTVETHRRNIKQKLSINSTAALVRYAIEFGLTR